MFLLKWDHSIDFIGICCEVCLDRKSGSPSEKKTSALQGPVHVWVWPVPCHLHRSVLQLCVIFLFFFEKKLRGFVRGSNATPASWTGSNNVFWGNYLCAIINCCNDLHTIQILKSSSIPFMEVFFTQVPLPSIFLVTAVNLHGKRRFCP